MMRKAFEETRNE